MKVTAIGFDGRPLLYSGCDDNSIQMEKPRDKDRFSEGAIIRNWMEYAIFLSLKAMDYVSKIVLCYFNVYNENEKCSDAFLCLQKMRILRHMAANSSKRLSLYTQTYDSFLKQPSPE